MTKTGVASSLFKSQTKITIKNQFCVIGDLAFGISKSDETYIIVVTFIQFNLIRNLYLWPI